MKALGFELLEFAELEDLDHILSRDQKAVIYRAFDEFRCDFMEKSESLSLYS